MRVPQKTRVPARVRNHHHTTTPWRLLVSRGRAGSWRIGEGEDEAGSRRGRQRAAGGGQRAAGSKPNSARTTTGAAGEEASSGGRSRGAAGEEGRGSAERAGQRGRGGAAAAKRGRKRKEKREKRLATSGSQIPRQQKYGKNQGPLSSSGGGPRTLRCRSWAKLFSVVYFQYRVDRNLAMSSLQLA